ncbi:MAG: fibronectin type III domain-containing protein [Nitrospirae bacterium]|nr:fibronectin type III domain-containing protein [Nitrospirota bacterium]
MDKGLRKLFIYDQSGNLIEEADEDGQINSDYVYLENIPIAKIDEWWEGMILPEAPTGLVVTPGDSQLTVSWASNTDTDTDTGIDGYKVYYGTQSGNYTNSVDVGDTTSYTITGLTNGTTYYVSVTAYADLKETYFYHVDYLGTPILMTDKNGKVVWEKESLPFGEEYFLGGSITNNIGFPGQYYDIETGLYQNWHRDYNPEIGRYVEKDRIGAKGGINQFTYTKNNPINWVDPRGLDRLNFNGSTLSWINDQGQTVSTYSALSGPYGMGRLPAGNYTGQNLRRRTISAMTCSGGNGWSLDLVPNFQTCRTLLRIHPDGGVHGTEGCIGVSCDSADQLYNDLYDYFGAGYTSIPVEVKY